MNIKKELAVFFIWFRNGICFAFTWLLLLRLIALKVNGIDTISVTQLIEMLLWAAGGVLIFCIAFRKLVLRKTGFTARLTLFMVLITAYEAGYFYHEGLFTGSGHAYEWLLFSIGMFAISVILALKLHLCWCIVPLFVVFVIMIIIRYYKKQNYQRIILMLIVEILCGFIVTAIGLVYKDIKIIENIEYEQKVVKAVHRTTKDFDLIEFEEKM